MSNATVAREVDCVCRPGESVVDAMMRVASVESVKPWECTSESGNTRVTSRGCDVELTHESLRVDVTLADSDCQLHWEELLSSRRVRIHAKLIGRPEHEADRTIETYSLSAEVLPC